MINLEFRIDEIKILRSFVWDYNLKGEETNFNNVFIDINIEFSSYDNHFSALMGFQYDYKEAEQKVINLARFDIIYNFTVTDLEEILKDEVLTKKLILNIISVSYSTSRGIIFSETKGFVLNKLLLKPKNATEVYEAHYKHREIHRLQG